MSTEEYPEVYFLRFAFACAEALVDQDIITQEQHDEMKNSILTNTPLDRDYLENIFTNAFKGLKKIDDAHYMTHEIIRKYFCNQHEENLQHLAEPARNFCLVKNAKVVKRLTGNFYRVEMEDGTTRPVHMEICPDVQIGDIVRVHRAYAAEKIK